MQDRFKFRVFDKQINKMIEPTRHFNYCIVNGTIVGIESYSSEGAFYEKRITKEFDDAIIMQCTGLKDKNGKLIFEGDIVRSDEYPYMSKEQDNYYAEICWDEKSAQFFYYTFKNPQFNDVSGISTGNTGNLDEYNWEVIGNVYQNPELLNKEVVQ